MIQITDSDPSRCKAAYEFLSAGAGVAIGSYSLRIRADQIAEVGVPSKWQSDNLTTEREEEDIAEARHFFRTTVLSLPHLGEKLAALPFSFILIDDYGKGSVALTEPTTPKRL